MLKFIKVLKFVLSDEAQVLVTLMRNGFNGERDDKVGLTSHPIASNIDEYRKLSRQRYVLHLLTSLKVTPFHKGSPIELTAVTYVSRSSIIRGFVYSFNDNVEEFIPVCWLETT